MIRNFALRGGFILLSGIAFPFLSGIISYRNYSVIELLGSALYFFLIAFLISSLCVWVISKRRKDLTIIHSPLEKIIAYTGFSMVLSIPLTSILVFGWLKISKEIFSGSLILKASLMNALFALIFILSYEILLLSAERLLDRKIVDQLDKERSNAELSALSNELDPHFMFNSLTTLSHLISTDTQSASHFNQKLAEVYKYILVNKNREMISLQNEIEFIEDYFFLLKIRHEDKMQLDVKTERHHHPATMVLPCSLQILVENAIKHNEFSKKNPLLIQVQLNGNHIAVMNNINPRQLTGSTKLGLRNLSDRYKLIYNKDIVIEEQKNHFIVKLPLITQ